MASARFGLIRVLVWGYPVTSDWRAGGVKTRSRSKPLRILKIVKTLVRVGRTADKAMKKSQTETSAELRPQILEVLLEKLPRPVNAGFHSLHAALADLGYFRISHSFIDE